MSDLIVTEFISLDGVIEDPSFTAPYFSDAIGTLKNEEYFGADALLFGATTWTIHAGAWPSQTDPFAERLNTMPKYVVSSTVDPAGWTNTTRLSGDPVEEVGRLKQSVTGDVLVDGSARLVDLLLREGLVDQIDLLVFPVVLGTGDRLFKDGTAATFELVSAETLTNGVQHLRYRATEQNQEEA